MLVLFQQHLKAEVEVEMVPVVAVVLVVAVSVACGKIHRQKVDFLEAVELRQNSYLFVQCLDKTRHTRRNC